MSRPFLNNVKISTFSNETDFGINLSLAIVTEVTSISGVMPNSGEDSLPFDDLTMFLYDLGKAPKVKRALPPVSYLSVTFQWKASA